MAEYTWIWLNKQDSQYASCPKYAKNFDFGKILNMARVLDIQALHSGLNMPEYALTDFWIYLGFQASLDY